MLESYEAIFTHVLDSRSDRYFFTVLKKQCSNHFCGRLGLVPLRLVVGRRPDVVQGHDATGRLVVALAHGRVHLGDLLLDLQTRRLK